MSCVRPPSSCLFNHQPVRQDLHSLLGLILLTAQINSVFQSLCTFPTCSLLFPAFEEQLWERGVGRATQVLDVLFPGSPLLFGSRQWLALRVCPSPLLPSCQQSCKDVSPVVGQEMHKEELQEGVHHCPHSSFCGNVPDAILQMFQALSRGYLGTLLAWMIFSQSYFSSKMSYFHSICHRCSKNVLSAYSLPSRAPLGSHGLPNIGEQSDHSSGFMFLLFFPLVFQSWC